jgi:hypothetical protein
VLLQAALDGKGQSLETLYTDGPEPRRPAPVPENTTSPRPVQVGRGSEVHQSASQMIRPHPARYVSFTAGLRAAMELSGGQSAEETGVTADLTWTSAILGITNHNYPSDQVRLLLLPEKALGILAEWEEQLIMLMSTSLTLQK